MSSIWRLGLIAVALLSLGVGVSPSAAPLSGRAAISIPRNSLSQDSVLGILLLLISQEDAKLRMALESLYESQFISSNLETRKDVERYLGGVLAYQFQDQVSGDLFAVMMQYLRLIMQEAREDRKISRSQLRTETVRIGRGLEDDELEQFRERGTAWLTRLQASLAKVGNAELEMLQMQSLVSKRQRAIELMGTLSATLEESVRRLANMEPPPDEPSSSTTTSKDPESHCPACGCDCH
jgi:hypothetical protein